MKITVTHIKLQVAVPVKVAARPFYGLIVILPPPGEGDRDPWFDIGDWDSL